VLDLAKVEAGRLELFYETFPIAQTVRETVTACAVQPRRKGSPSRSTCPPDLGLITADQIRFKQILFNLLSNAVKFTTARVAVSGSIESGQLHVAVTDTGIGMRTETWTGFLSNSARWDDSHARRHEGTGLGLALSKRLVEAHGGRIWLDSKSVRQHFSRVAATAAAEFPNTESAQDQGGDPKWKVRAPVLKPGCVPIRATPSWWWKTTAGGKAPDALSHPGGLRRAGHGQRHQCAGTGRPVPPDGDHSGSPASGLDGWEVLSELKASPRTRDIPVVIVSVLDSSRSDSGWCSEYLVKPVERAELLHALRRCVHRKGENMACHKVMVVHSDPDELNLLALILAQEAMR